MSTAASATATALFGAADCRSLKLEELFRLSSMRDLCLKQIMACGSHGYLLNLPMFLLKNSHKMMDYQAQLLCLGKRCDCWEFAWINDFGMSSAPALPSGTNTPAQVQTSCDVSSRWSWKDYTNGELSPKTDFDGNSSFRVATPFLKSFMQAHFCMD